MTYIETSWDDAFDYAMSLVTRPTPAQEWLASLVNVPLPDPPERCIDCGLADCKSPHTYACPDCGMDVRLHPNHCIVEMPEHCDMDAYRRYRELYGEEEG